MTGQTLLQLHDNLRRCPWRDTHRFSEEMEVAHHDIFTAPSSTEAAGVVREWLRSHQPCIFARFAVRHDGLVHLCVLREDDLVRGDDHVAEVIRRARQRWRIQALQGKSHSFLVLITTERLTLARPDEHLRAFAERFLQLYVGRSSLDDVVFDHLYFQDTLEERPRYFEWKNGINVFAPQGDGRWWHDHRIPGGVAFAMNAVGHMAYSFAGKSLPGIAMPLRPIRDALVRWALPVAMQTIELASRGVRKGSWLLPGTRSEPPPFDTQSSYGRKLADKDWRKYGGAYHTDHTLPSVFFIDSETRPDGCTDFDDLDFSYLHDVREADHELIATGVSVEPIIHDILRSVIEGAAEDKQ